MTPQFAFGVGMLVATLLIFFGGVLTIWFLEQIGVLESKEKSHAD